MFFTVFRRRSLWFKIKIPKYHITDTWEQILYFDAVGLVHEKRKHSYKSMHKKPTTRRI